MRFNLKSGRLLVAVAGAALMAGFAATPARADVVGQLQCNISPGAGALVVSSRAVSCVFQSGAGPAELYTGAFSRLGLDVGELSGGQILYNVVALGVPAPGSLSGDYIGAGFGVTLGTGGGINALVGGGNSFTLQPISATTSTGTNINAGLGELHLAYVGPARPRMRRGHRRHRMMHRHHM